MSERWSYPSFAYFAFADREPGRREVVEKDGDGYSAVDGDPNSRFSRRRSSKESARTAGTTANRACGEHAATDSQNASTDYARVTDLGWSRAIWCDEGRPLGGEVVTGLGWKRSSAQVS